MNPIEGILRSGCLSGKDFFICRTTGKTVKGILRQEGIWKVKLETAEGDPEYHTLACPWDSTHPLEAKHDGSRKTLACKGCGGLWLAIIEKDSRLEYYPKSVTADFTEEGEIPILESEQVNFVKDTHIDMTTEMQSQPSLLESRQEACQKIQAQIVKGQELRNQTIRSEDELEKARAESKKWSEYNKQLLSRLFTDSSIADRCWLFHDYTPAINAWLPSERTVEEDRTDDQYNSRARQNVVLELGYFIGKLGRERVCPIYKGEIELPSDLDGVLYIRMDEPGAWRQNLAQEMASAGLPIV